MTETGTVSEAEAELAKLKRRQARNQRKAQADGFLLGVTAMLKPGDFVIDCGANIGNVTEPLAETGAHVHCFEPDPFAFRKLSKRFDGNPSVTLQNAAVGVDAGTVQLMRAENFDDNRRGASVKSTVVSGGRMIDEARSVEVERIDFIAFLRQAVERHGEVAFLKMDIEGAELEILEAMEREDLFAPVRAMVVETHERKFKALRPRFKALRERVSAAYPLRKVNLDWI